MKKNTTHNLTVAAMLSAVAFILMFIEFPMDGSSVPGYFEFCYASALQHFS